MSDFDICQFILIRMAYKVLISPRSNVTFNISLHEVCVRVVVRYVITKFSRMDSLPNFLTHGASRARELRYQRYLLHYYYFFILGWVRTTNFVFGRTFQDQRGGGLCFALRFHC